MPGRLDDYDSKRDFETTPEPAGALAGSDSGRLYVIQKHAATRLHYDLRLEHDGVLMSWAVPKGPSFDTKQRRLAVHVEDHPVEYGGFEGVIPESEYGGGTVMLWDRGTWNPHGDVGESLAAGKLVFDIDGEKLHGRFGLIHTGVRKSGREQNQWLLIKEKDAFVRPNEEYDVTSDLPDSVATGRTMEQIAEDGPSLDESGEDEDEAEPPGLRSALPADLGPQLPTLVDGVPVGEQWVHEIKYDGYRLLLLLEDGHARALTREGHDWSDRFAMLLEAIKGLPVTSAVLDVEAVVAGVEGGSDFGALQRALADGRGDVIVAYCFDLLFQDGRDLRELPLLERKRALERILAAQPSASRLRYADHIAGDPDSLLENACELGAEGLVSKRADSPYRAGRSRAWLKTKCVSRQEFVVVGHTAPKGGRTGFGALLLAYHAEDGHLVYAGRVGSGFADRELRDLAEALAPLRRDTPPLPGPPAQRGVTWVEPQLVVEVAFGGWTPGGLLRHASFVARRDDRDPSAVQRDAASSQVAGVAITHPDRVMIPGGPTKLDLATFYAEAAPHVLRHLGERPLTLLRCPQGGAGDCFWQRHIDESGFAGVHSRVSDGREFVFVEDAVGLVELVQYLTVEFHTWGSRVEHPDFPDRLVFDLDPGADTHWDDVRAAALLVREVLERRGLASFVKTSGGKGLHVVAPVEPRVPVRDAAAACKAISLEAVGDSGDRLTIDPHKSNRAGRIFLDWHRNGAAQSTVAAYVVRARPGAPVSTPLDWDELRRGVDPSSFTAAAVLERLQTLGDPWESIGDLVQHLPEESLDF